jgi:hypothetical protein
VGEGAAEVSSDTPLPRPVTEREPRVCPLCGGALRLSHREYVGGRRSVRVLRCKACGAQVRGEPQDDDARPRPALPARRRPLPDGGHPENFVIDEATAEHLRQMLEGEPTNPDS